MNPTCWQLYYDSFKGKLIRYYLHEFYTDKELNIPKKYNKTLSRFLKQREEYNNKINNIDRKLQNIIGKFIKNEI